MFKSLFNLIAGSQLGKQGSSWDHLGPLNTSQAFGQAKQRIFINPVNGNLYLEDHQKHIQVNGYGLSIGMVYNSIDNQWRFSQGKRLGIPISSVNQTGSQITLINPDGSEIIFNYDVMQAAYVATGLAHGNQILKATDEGTWSLRHVKEGLRELFDAQGRQVQTLDTMGRYLNFRYTDAGELAAIDASDASITLTRQDYELRVRYETKTTTEELMLYNLDPQGVVQHTSIHLDKETYYQSSFQYTGNQLSNIAQEDGTSVGFSFVANVLDENKPVLDGFRFGDGRIYHLQYKAQQTTLTNAYQDEQLFEFDNEKRLTAYIKPTLDKVGEKQTYIYDVPGHIEKIVDADGASREFSYHPTLGLVTREQTSLGQRTDYYYADEGRRTSWAQHLVEHNQSRMLTTYEVRDEKRQLTFEVNPQGGVTQHGYDNQGNCDETNAFIAAGYDTQGLKPDSVITDTTMQTWAAKQDPTQQTLSRYGHNERGQRTAIVHYANRDGRKGRDDAFAYHEVRQWDKCNHITKRTVRQRKDEKGEPVNCITQKTYDGLERTTKSVDASGHETRFDYADAMQTVTVTHPNGLVEMTRWNGAGQPKQIVESDGNVATERLTDYGYDLAGRLYETIAPDMTRTLTLADPQDRLGLTIDALNRVVRIHYDVRNNRQQTIAYQASITLPADESPYTLAAILPQLILTPDKDRYETRLHDSASRLCYEVKADGAVTRTQWDSVNRETGVISYVNRLALSILPALRETKSQRILPLIVPAKADRHQNLFYTDDNLPIGEQVGTPASGGFVKQFMNNHLWQIKQVSFKQQIPLTRDESKLFPTPTADDAKTYDYHDLRGQTTGICDAENYLTEHVHIACGKQGEKIRYVTKVDPSKGDTVTVLRPKPNPEDFHWQFAYDLNNREIKMIELPLGKQTLKSYDAVGNTIYRASGPLPTAERPKPPLRAYHTRFNVWSQTTEELNPRAANQLAAILADDALTEAMRSIEIFKLWNEKGTHYFYDATGLQRQKQIPEGAKTLFYFDKARRLVVTINALGAVTENTPDTFDDEIETRQYAHAIEAAELATLQGGQLTPTLTTYLEQIKDPKKDIVIQQQFDNASRPLISTDGEGYTTLKVYTAFGQVEKLQKPVTQTRFITDSFAYDGRGHCIQTNLDVTHLNIQTRAAYNFLNVREKRVDGEGNCYSYNSDKLGRITETQWPNGLTEAKTWDAHGRPLTETDTTGAVWTTQYQTAQRTTINTSPAGRTHTVITNVFAQPVETIDGLGNVEKTAYEPGGLVEKTEDALGRCAHYLYSISGWQLSKTDKNALQTINTHDVLGRITVVAEQENSAAMTTVTLTKREQRYDNFDRKIAMQDANGVWTKQHYDRRNLNVETIIDPNPTVNNNEADVYRREVSDERALASPASHLHLITQKTYDGQRQPTLITEGDAKNTNQRQTQMAYNGLGKKVKKILDPKTTEIPNGLALTEQWVHNRNGQVIKYTDANGNVTRLYFDTIGRLAYRLHADGALIGYVYHHYLKEVLDTRSYYFRIDRAVVTDETTLAEIAKLAQAIQSDALDVTTKNRYDLDKTLAFHIEGAGHVVQYHTDAAHRDYGHTDYATPIDSTKLKTNEPEEITPLIIPSTDDRGEWHALDAVGKATYTLERSSATQVVVTFFGRDEMNDEIVKTDYALPIALTIILQLIRQDNRLPIASIKQHIQTSQTDRTQYQIFDSLQRLLYHVDAERYVDSYLYDNETNITDMRRYSARVIIPAKRTPTTMAQALKNLKVGRQTQTIYDAAERIIDIIDGLENHEHFKRDALGQCIEKTDKLGEIWQTKFDRAGREITTTSPVTTIAETTLVKGKITLTQRQAAIVTHYVPDNNGNVLQVIAGVGTKNVRTMQMQYDVYDACIKTEIVDVEVDNPKILAPTDPATRPVIKQTLTTEKVFNALRQVIVSQDEAGNLKFTVHSKDGNPHYQIDGCHNVTVFTNNAFKQATDIFRYAKPLDFNPDTYRKTGITFLEMEQWLVHQKTPGEDRSLNQVFDNRGLKIKANQDAIWFHTVDEKTGETTTQKAFPETRWGYNRFKEPVVKATLIQSATQKPPRPADWAEIYFWHDNNGNKIAVVDENHYLTRYRVNFDGAEIERDEFALAILLEGPISEIDETMLQTAITKSKLDRHYSQAYDALGQVVRKTQQGVVLQTVKEVDGKRQLVDLPPQDLTTTIERNALGSPIKTVHPNGASTEEKYNALNQPIKKIKPPRDTLANHKQPRQLYEVAYLSRNVHSNVVQTIRAETTNPKATYAPKASDQITLKHFDKRGKVMAQRDPENHEHYFTQTELGLLARRYLWLTSWPESDDTHPINLEAMSTVSRLSQQRFAYDANKHQTAEHRLANDGKTETSLYKQYNAFGEVAREGKDNQTWSLERKRNQIGRVYQTNEDKGTWKIKLTDGRGLMTETLIGNTKDLSQVPYAEIPSLLPQPYADIQQLKLARDKRGKVIRQYQPEFKHLKPGMPEPIELVLAVGKAFPAFGKYSISWPQIDDKSYIAKVTMWVQGDDPNTATTFTTKVINQRVGLDVTEMTTDYYVCQINYYFHNPLTQHTDVTPRFRAELPALGLDTGNTQHSKHAVLLQEGENTIVATGKLEQLSGIEVYPKDSKVPIGRVPYNSESQVGVRLVFDLSDLPTGDYQFKPIHGFVPVGNRVTLNEVSTAGFKLEYHHTQPSMVPVTEVWSYDIYSFKFTYDTNAIRWSDLPPNVTKLAGLMAYSYNQWENWVAWEHFPNTGQYLYPGFPALPIHVLRYLPPYNNPVTTPFRLAVNQLYAVDKQNHLWLIGNAFNREQSAETKTLPYLYVMPEGKEVAFDTLLVSRNEQFYVELPPTPWMDGLRRVDVSGMTSHNDYRYQAARLNPAKSNAPLSLPVRIITRTNPSRLIATHLGDKNFRLNSYSWKVAVSVDNVDNAISVDPAGVFVIWGVEKSNIPEVFKDNLFYIDWNGLLSADNGVSATTGFYGKGFFNSPYADYADNKDNLEKLLSNVSYSPFYIDGNFRLNLKMYYQGNKVSLFSGTYSAINRKIINTIKNLNHVKTTCTYSISSLFIYPVPSNSYTIELYYLDTALTVAPQWRNLTKDIAYTPGNFAFTVDVRSVSPSRYQYCVQIKDKAGNIVDLSHLITFKDGWGYDYFAMNDGGRYVVTPPQKAYYEKVSPDAKQTFDRWGNVVAKQNERGNVTNFTFNALNGMTQKIQPEISVTDETGQASLMRPTTHYGFDANNKVIGVTDPGAHTMEHKRNLVGETVETIRADDVWRKFIKDGFGNDVEVETPTGPIKQTYDHNNQMTARSDQDRHTSYSVYDGLKQEITRISPMGYYTRQVFDADGNVTLTYRPLGQRMKTVFDANREPIYQGDGNGRWPALTWRRDYFGNSESHTDRAGALITFTRNPYNHLLIKQTGTVVAGHGWQYGPDGNHREVPGQEITYVQDEAGHTRAILDDGVPITTEYHIGEDGETTGERFIASNGHVYQDTIIERNACDWLTKIYDVRVGGKYQYTPEGYRRATQMYYFWENDEHPYLKENWNTFNPAGLTLIAKGNLVKGKIQIANNKGLEFRYDNAGWRHQQIQIVNGNEVITTLQLRATGLLSTTSAGVAWASYGYDHDSNNTFYEVYKQDEKKAWHTTATNTEFNANGWAIYTNIHLDGKPSMETYLNDFMPGGQPLKQLDYSPSEDDWKNNKDINAFYDDLTTTYVGFESLKTQQCEGKRERWNNPDKETYGTVYATLDSNGNIQSIQGNLTDKASWRGFITNSENRIVYKSTNLFNHAGNEKEEFYFYWLGNPIGRLGDLDINPHPKHQAPPQKDVNFDLFDCPYGVDTRPKGESEYLVQAGQTYEDISRIVEGGDPSFAQIIAHANHQTAQQHPPVGEWIKIPDMTGRPQHNWVGIYAVYNQHKIIGSMFPNMPIPPAKPIHHHHSFWHILIEAVIGAAIFAVLAPELLALLSTLGSLLANGITDFVAALASNIGEQEAAVLLGDQKALSLHSVIKAVVSEEELFAAAEIVGVNPEALTSVLKEIPLAKSMEMNGVLEVLQLATGQIKHLSWQEFVTNVLSDEANSEIGKGAKYLHLPDKWETQFATNESKALADELIGDEIYHQKLAADRLAGNSLGTAIGQTLGGELEQAKQQKQKTKHETKEHKQWLASQNKGDLERKEKELLTNPLKEAEYINGKLQAVAAANDAHKHQGLFGHMPRQGQTRTGNTQRNKTYAQKPASYTRRRAEQESQISYSQQKVRGQQVMSGREAERETRQTHWLSRPVTNALSDAWHEAKFVYGTAKTVGPDIYYGLKGLAAISSNPVKFVTGQLVNNTLKYRELYENPQGYAKRSWDAVESSAIDTYSDIRSGDPIKEGQIFGRGLEFAVGGVLGKSLRSVGMFAEVGAESSLQFELVPRVEAQLKDSRLGELAGKLNINSLNELASNPNAQFLYDSGTGHINVIQNVEGKLLRITVPRDTFKIISVGPIQERNLINSIANGRFVPIGGQLEEATQLDEYMMRVQP